MTKAARILFNPFEDHKPLFKNQLDLVSLLINTSGSAYFLESTTPEEVKTRAVGRLKTFVSQLLSDSVPRVVTEDFKYSLKLILAKKLSDREAEKYFGQIITALNEKNDALNKSADSDNTTSKLNLKDDITSANYISVITSRPINMDNNENEGGFSIKKHLFDDLAATLTTQHDRLKYYRFNFPLDSYCDLFWLGLEKIVQKFLLDHEDDDALVHLLYESKFSITTAGVQLYERYQREKVGYSPTVLQEQRKALFQQLSREIIERLNRNKIIMVFSVDLPIFTVPTIAINPNESTSKLYGLLDFAEQKNLVYKFTSENILLWRIFVWDKMKAMEKGKNIPFKSQVSNLSLFGN